MSAGTALGIPPGIFFFRNRAENVKEAVKELVRYPWIIVFLKEFLYKTPDVTFEDSWMKFLKKILDEKF